MLDTKKNKLNYHSELIDIRKYLTILKKYRLIIFLNTLVVATIAIVTALSITPIYRATSTLLIENLQPNIVSIENVVGIDTTKQEYHQTQYEILKSNRIAERVINKLNLSTIPEFNDEEKSTLSIAQLTAILYSIEAFQPYLPKQPALSQASRQEKLKYQVLTTFKSKLTITPITQTHLVNVSFESEDPSLAAKIANEIGNEYINSIQDARISVTNDTSGWLDSRLTDLKQNLITSEDNLASFLKQEGLIDMGAYGGIGSLASSEISDLVVRIAVINERRIAAESLSEQLRRSSTINNLASISSFSRHPQMRDIRMALFDAEKLVSELANSYGPKHDKMIQAKSQLQSARQSAKILLAQLLEEQDKERQALLQQELSLKKILVNKKDEYQQLTIKEANYSALKRDVESNRQLYDTFLKRQKETNASGSFNNASFSDHALTPQIPIKPQKGMIVGLATIITMLLSISIILLLESLRDTIEGPEDIESKLGLALLGSVPQIKPRRFKSPILESSVYFRPKAHFFTEAIRSIRTSLLLSPNHETNKLITLTSAIPHEGKTTISINLAVSMARMEKVLLIDCDLRNSSVGERFGLKHKHPGVADILTSNVTIDKCIYHDEKSDLDILPAGLMAPNPQELLSSQNFKLLLTQLQNHYDHILIDTPPCQAVSDALIVARLTGSVELIVKAGSTSLNLVKSTVSKLFSYDIAINGVILNQVEKKHSRLYNDYDGYSRNYQMCATADKAIGQGTNDAINDNTYPNNKVNG